MVAHSNVTQSHQHALNAIDPQPISLDSSRMAFAHMILAALIATSLASVPIEGTAVSSSTISVEMSMADQADMSCCPPADDGKGSIACVFKCICAAAMLPTTIAISHVPDELPSLFVGATLLGYVSRPAHPPPI